MKDKTKPGYIYKVILDIPEPHIVYIGSTTQKPNERLGHHATIQKRPTRLNKLIRSIGREHFSIEIIEWVQDYNKRFERERYWTEQYKDIPDNCNECLGTKHSEEMCQRDSLNSYRNRAVICENDGERYRSSVEASEKYNVCDSDIRECCAMHLIQSKGYYFRYADADLDAYLKYWESANLVRNNKVRCVDTGELYDSVKDAMNKLGLTRHQVEGSCRNGRVIRNLKIRLEYVKPYAVLPNHA